MTWCLCCKLIRHRSIIYGNEDSFMQGRMGTGTTLKLIAGIGAGMGIRVLGTVIRSS